MRKVSVLRAGDRGGRRIGAKFEQGSAPVHAFEAKLGAYANSAADRGTDNAGSRA